MSKTAERSMNVRTALDLASKSLSVILVSISRFHWAARDRSRMAAVQERSWRRDDQDIQSFGGEG